MSFKSYSSIPNIWNKDWWLSTPICVYPRWVEEETEITDEDVEYHEAELIAEREDYLENEHVPFEFTEKYG